MKWKVYTNKYYYQQGVYVVTAETEKEAIQNWETGEFLGTDVVIETSEDYFELEEELFDWVEQVEEPSEVESK
tara:strand:+ start:310 stop:528 length:219 start_codon:yes stop_codon:yes gene_type:complete